MNVLQSNGRVVSAAAVFLLCSLSGAVASLHAPRSFAADDDDYTRAIRSEGSRLESLNKPAEEPAGPAPAPAARVQSVEDFERALRAEAPASLRFYGELDPSRKRQAYEMYLKEGRISDGIKRFIVKLRLGS